MISRAQLDAGDHLEEPFRARDGKVTGFVIRGRATLDKLLQFHLHRPLQLTRAGGERPSYSIAAGE